jgi:hypothetical protein
MAIKPCVGTWCAHLLVPSCPFLPTTKGCAGLMHTLQHDELLGGDRRRGSRDNVEDISDDSGYTRKNSRDNVTDISR